MTLSCSLQIPGQRLVYRFGKLPYKYEPGVTRSRRYGHRIKACIQRHMPQPPSSSLQINPDHLSWSFSPVSTRLRKSCSWPLIPNPSHSILWYPVPTQHTPPIPDSSKSRIFLPLFEESSFPGSANGVVFEVDPMTSSSLSSVFKNPLERIAPVVEERIPRATSIAVPVIKWIWERTLLGTKQWPLVQICFAGGKEIDQQKSLEAFSRAKQQCARLFVGCNNYIRDRSFFMG